MAASAPMTAIFRTGKFLRLFSGVARNLAASNGAKNEEAGGLVPSSSGGGLAFDGNFVSQANFSIQNVLPYLGVSDSGHAEDRYLIELIRIPNIRRISFYCPIMRTSILLLIYTFGEVLTMACQQVIVNYFFLI